MKTTFRNILVAVLLFVPVTIHGNVPEGVTLRYRLGYDNTTVTLKIWNSGSGSEVKTLLNNQIQSEGWHEVLWDGRDNSGTYVATGTYIYRIKIVVNGGTTEKAGYLEYIK